MTTAQLLIQEIRAELEAVEQEIRRHPYLAALESGRVRREDLTRFAGEQYHMIDRISEASRSWCIASEMTTTLLFYGHWFRKGDRLNGEEMEKVRSSAALLPVGTARQYPGFASSTTSTPGVWPTNL